MKKIMILAASALMLSATSCLKSSNKVTYDDDADNGNQKEAVANEKALKPTEEKSLSTVNAGLTAENAGDEAVSTKELPANVPAVFREMYAADPTIVVLPSGLMYKVIEEGTGDSPTVGDDVKVKYVGSHVDGSVFDQSDSPITFNLGRVIPGFSEGITHMNRGAKYMLLIPSDLGYGERGAGNVIAPNEPLIFTIELLDF